MTYFTWPVMLVWGACCILMLRGLLWMINKARRASRIRRRWTYVAAIAVFAVLGLGLTAFSGMSMYGFDPGNPWHQFGYWNLFIAPWGMPLLLGIPGLLLIDVASIAIGRLKRAAA